MSTRDAHHLPRHPFNAPFYSRVGFVEVRGDARLEKILEHERELKIDIAPRVAMALGVT